MQDPLLQREQWWILGILLLLSLVAWIFTFYQARSHAALDISSSSAAPMSQMGHTHGSSTAVPGMSMPGMAIDTPATSANWGSIVPEALLFLIMWLAMMVAMMFPSVYPMVLLFARVSGGQSTRTGQSQVPTWIFVAGYLAIWTVVGGVMYLAYLAVRWAGIYVTGGGYWMTIGSGIALMAAGLYQFSPWKGVCLTHCRSPLSFMLHKWREGAFGAWRMGLDHGAYCVGCCWGLMIVMFAMGLMNIAWMGFLTVVIFGEKITRYGPALSKVVGALLILLGLAILIDPSLAARLAL
jgi:predicted metal-binding membrane protein